ncbi:SMC family ATPase [Aphanizomenon flos-aquae NRERC-008]|uniref:Nuclease SbcCD subunit C n=1 Tax=Aphanizomenon flos-aquae FACHB-1249 TaxID=2692889 RepID=A0ABR8IW20_APHFL|nr:MULTISPECIES: SMC family ATPase [Aphanizomenon]MBD2392247.1 SMC family ATPase [Aphanizomenon flos-aquae FACHB-1171]MBD2558216.1 SMC family ATPase [Aphanizomenon flos-aquae FACHB-1290]MBD2633264.1 SMC family ATPase [Aphanizomenon sp. FACHB-1399]MBD2644187.1 SMC family ATPase [Aphanizomenon sp. FACHB-1401]MBD2658946.1 SMC family ATPase [Aphanizomenon flos-aquae FACHB-1265]
MIPIQLIIKNFLSYRDAALDFSGLHTACICGSNGAGKSSLLEAITWAIWGESRATVEDDVIHSGAKEVRIDFTFQSGQQTYRVIRNRVRGGTSILEFQIETTSGFRALTGKGLKATQDVILEHIKLDYETFINSAYLRQGKADEFMLKRPAERKEILAELLKLNQYDELEERAKNSFKIYRIRGEDLERSLENIKVQLQQREITENQRAELEAQLQDLQQVQTFENSQLQSLQVIQHQRQNWEQQLNFLRQRYDNLSQDSDRLQQEQIAVKSQLADLEKILNQEVDIQAGYTQYQNLQSQEEILSGKFEQHTRATNLKQQKQQQLYKQTQDLERQLQQAEAQLAALEQQEQEIIQTLSKSGDIETALSQLNNARQHLANLDQLQMQVTPLLQQRVKLQTQLDRTHASLVAKLEQIQATEKQLQNQHHRQPQLQQALTEIGTQIEELEKKRVYLQRVQEKGQERRHFIERLQAHQGDYEKLLAELEQKLQMLQNPDALCPLCERPLDEHHWSKVIEKTQSEYEDTQGQFWVVREQMAFSDREIQVLRQEYREISQKLSGYDSLREKRGQLAAQLQATTDVQQQLLQIISEKEHLEHSLEIGDYAPEKQAEIQELDHYLQQLNYSEKDHSLARSEVDKFRWAEIKQGQIKDALKRQAQLIAKKPELTTNISQLQLQLQQGQTDSNFAQEIANLEQQISEIAYNYEQHNYLRQSVRQGQSWQLRHQQLLSAQEQYPQFRNKSQDLEYSLQTIFKEKQTLIQQIDNIVKQLSDSANPTAQINTLEQQLANRRRELDNKISQLGQLKQMSLQLATLQNQYEQDGQQLQICKQQQRVYQELAQAFGKNGIQALMIENILPQLEAEANQLLSRLSANQFHVQFITQKAGRSGKSSKKNAKLIDTLDILIADARGTRSYETYSGGEAFRINFAIRLALAKLLAQRAGASLQLLVVDEGFGTQDGEGCDRLVAAINAISSDFACILTVTHMPHLKEAFQARIEVSKNQQGSQLQLLM